MSGRPPASPPARRKGSGHCRCQFHWRYPYARRSVNLRRTRRWDGGDFGWILQKFIPTNDLQLKLEELLRASRGELQEDPEEGVL